MWIEFYMKLCYRQIIIPIKLNYLFNLSNDVQSFSTFKRVESIGQLPFWYEMGACQNLVAGNDETTMLCFSTAQYYNTCYR